MLCQEKINVHMLCNFGITEFIFTSSYTVSKFTKRKNGNAKIKDLSD
jgi:hypothetical protein